MITVVNFTKLCEKNVIVYLKLHQNIVFLLPFVKLHFALFSLQFYEKMYIAIVEYFILM